MKNNKAIDGIVLALEESQLLLDHGQLLIEGDNSDALLEPKSHKECDFGLWLYSKGQSFIDFDWFKDVQENHQKMHGAYNKLQNETLRIYNPKTHEELIKFLSHFEESTDLFTEVLEVAKEKFLAMPDEEYQQLVDGSDITSNKDSEKHDQDSITNLEQPHLVENVVGTSEQLLKQLEPRRQLKEQDLEQLKLEQKLTRKELKQISERQKLTQKSVDQIDQYLSLKVQELKDHKLEQKDQEKLKTDAQTIKQQELATIQKQVGLKTKGLEKMEALSLKLDMKKFEEQKQGEASLSLLKGQQVLIQDDLKKLSKKQELIRKDMEQHMKKLQLAEKDMEQLDVQKDLKLQDLEKLGEQQSLNKEELEKESARQIEMKQHKLKVEDLKNKDLNILEEECELKQQELLSIDQELLFLKDEEIKFEKFNLQEMKQLEEQQSFKQNSLDKLEENHKLKQHDLERLEHQQTSIKSELKQMEQQLQASSVKTDEKKPESAKEKELEEA